MTNLDHQLQTLSAGALPIPLPPEGRAAWEAQFNKWPAVRQYGMKLELSDPVAVRIRIDELHPYHLGGVGDAAKGGGHSINGAIIAGMFDAVLGVAGALQLPGRRAGTVDLSIKMFRSVVGLATAYGWALRRSGSVVFVEAMLVDQQGTRCAQASGMVCASESGPGGSRSDAPKAAEPAAAW